MSYIGTRPELAILERVGPFTGDGNTSSFTLSRPPGNAEALLVVEGGVVQQPNVSYEISGYNLNFIDANGDPRAPSAGVEIFGLFRGLDVSRKALGTAAARQIGTNSNDVPSITLADSRYANTAGDTFTGDITVSGDVNVSGTVDGRDVSSDGSKLDTIESSAKDDQTISAGSGLTGGGTGDVTLNHADTSSQSSVNNSGGTVIQDIDVDSFGHVTNLGSKSLTPADVGALGVNDKADDSELLDGLNSSQFLRSDTSDTLNGNLTVSGDLTVDSSTLFVDSTGNNVGIGTTSPTHKLEVNGSFAATTKSFVIPHPTKPNKKLQYGSLEGPENGVYLRGTVSASTDTIHLPEYWTALVDPDSITVQLTPIGKHQDVYVKDIRDNQVVVGGLNEGSSCFYVIFAERVDVEKLEVEITD